MVKCEKCIENGLNRVIILYTFLIVLEFLEELLTGQHKASDQGFYPYVLSLRNLIHKNCPNGVSLMSPPVSTAGSL
jgi:hypothetical protein